MFDTYLDARARQAATGLEPGDPLRQTIAEARARQSRYFESLNLAVPKVHSSKDLLISGLHGSIPVRLVDGDARGDKPCVIFLRGAGFWAGSNDSHRRTIHLLALMSGFQVCAIDYRHTPEYAYPVQQQEVIQVYQWLRQNMELDRRGCAIYAESAGATLALTSQVALREAGVPLPRGLVLLYPNSSGPRPGGRPYSEWVWRNYLGETDAHRVPGPVPLHQDLRGLPSVWLGCGGEDPLVADARDLERKFVQAGVPCEVQIFPGMPHAFIGYSATLRPAQDALRLASNALRRFLS